MDILQRSVGRGCANKRHDVLLVQQLINHQLGLIGPIRRLSEDGYCGSHTIDAILEYQRRVVRMNHPDGRVDPGGQTLRQLRAWTSISSHLADTVRAAQVIQSHHSGRIAPVTEVAPGGGKNQKYTNDPNEVSTAHTYLIPVDLVSLLKRACPQLTEVGARTLTAQCLHETGGGKHCYNWKLGNVKSPSTSFPHMYLHHVWEVNTAERTKGSVQEANRRSPGSGRIASDEEAKRNHWTHQAGQVVGVFEPPSRESRFRAYSSLQDGAQKWMDTHLAYVKRHSVYLFTLIEGSAAA